MRGTKRNALGGAIDMSGAGDGDVLNAVDLNTISITTVTVPTSKRLRGSRKLRRHQVPDLSPAQDSSTLSSSSTPRDGAEDRDSAMPHAGQSTADSQHPAPFEMNEVDNREEENVDVHIGDDEAGSDSRAAPVRIHQYIKVPPQYLHGFTQRIQQKNGCRTATYA